MTALDLEHIENLLKDRQDQSVIALLPNAYPLEFNDVSQQMLKVAVMAAEHGNVDVIEHFIKQYATSPSGPLAFHEVVPMALIKNQRAVVSLVTPHWFAREFIAPQSFTDYAIATNSVDTVRFATTFTNKFWPDKLLVFAARTGALDLLDLALQEKAAPEKDRHKALSAAIANGQTQAAEKLWPYLEREPDDTRPRTALMMVAASVSNQDAAGFLQRAQTFAGSDLDNLAMGKPLHEYTFRFVGDQRSITITAAEVDAFLSHRSLSAEMLNQEKQLAQENTALRRSSSAKKL